MEKLCSGLNVESSSHMDEEVGKKKSSSPTTAPKVVGLRFSPTDKVLIDFLQKKKADGKASDLICDVDDVFGFPPWKLLDIYRSSTPNKDDTAYIFTQKRQQHSSSEVTTNGCRMWKPTPSSQNIVDAWTERVIGFKRKLIYSIPDSSSAREIHPKWIMKEYSLPKKVIKEEVKEEENEEEWVLCKIKREKTDHSHFEEAAPSEDDSVVTIGEDGALNEEKAGRIFQAQQKENELKTMANISTDLHKHVRASPLDPPRRL